MAKYVVIVMLGSSIKIKRNLNATYSPMRVANLLFERKTAKCDAYMDKHI